MRPAEDIDKLIKKLRYKAGAETHNRILGNVMQTLEKKEKQKSGATAPNIWRIIMKSKITRFAAAAAIIIVAGIFLSLLGQGTPTFAQVIEPILNARTVVLDFIVGSEETGPVIHDIIVGSRIRRTFSNMDTILIIDLDNAKMLTLDPSDKSAVYVNIQGSLQEGKKHYIKFVRKVLMKLKDSPDIQELGECQIDGQKAIGFSGRGVKIWADLHTAVPIRVELQFGQRFMIMKNFKFDAPIEDSMISMDVPSGYKLEETEFDFSGDATEQDFIETLRIWAEVLLDGRFPEAVSTENFMKQVPLLEEKLEQLNLTDDEETKQGMKFLRGIFFLKILETEDKCHYAGKGVKLGDAEKAIFWYQPKESEMYRVIYGDLSVKDVAPENLPK